MAKSIFVLGAGSWGTALAINSARSTEQVYLWAHRKVHADNLIKDHRNTRYLPKTPFPNNLIPTNSLEAIKKVDAILIVVPSHAFRETLDLISPYIKDQSIGWATKGFDQTNLQPLSSVFNEYFPNRDCAVVAGPSFAKEVAEGLPTAITIAAPSEDFAKNYANFLHNNCMRAYTSTDIIGAQVGGAIKNIIAIATGISDGLGCGANTRAALITRGMREILRIADHFHANPKTMIGLSGLGDLILTCTDDLSRNRRMGLLLGQGKNLSEALAIINQTVEGIQTTKEVYHYAQKNNIRTPIIDTTYKIIQQQLTPEAAVDFLLNHPPKLEIL